MAPLSHTHDSSACERPDLAEKLALGNALDAAERAELERHVEACPSCGPNQRLLEEAEAWLLGRLPEQRAVELRTCPAADELYRFGPGPGAEPLTAQRRDAVADHLAQCRNCEAWVATLAQRPPVPLDLTPLRDDEAAEENEAPRVLPRAWRRSWVQLAAAALVLITVGVFWGPIRAGGPRPSPVPGGIVFPVAEVLRGTSSRSLYFPRDRVLAGESRGLRHELRFELAEREQAGQYRVFLMRNEAGAFDRGQAVTTFESAGTTLTWADATSGATAELLPGTYTWEGWAVVRGLETFLGRRDFEIVRDPALAAELDRLAELEEPRRSTETLALLHRRGHTTDARAHARGLPQTPERDAYLNSLPGR
jgi:hypothetical protein